jgi:hypothetical protein
MNIEKEIDGESVIDSVWNSVNNLVYSSVGGSVDDSVWGSVSDSVYNSIYGSVDTVIAYYEY